ncbi:hypothetical protein J4422_04180 [Candidatus Pacearchaeota archaeon]|nr:hypothetical protein [Candidatus Pacearchaeota archaeon]
MKTRNLLLTFGALAAAVIASENIGPKKTACDTYQGYENTYDARTVYVFDSLPQYQRIGDAGHALEGNPKLRNFLLNEDAIGKRFCFTYLDPISPLGYEMLKNITLEPSQVNTEISDGYY